MKMLQILFLVCVPIFCHAQIGGEDEVYLHGDRTEAKFNGGGLDEFGKFVNREFDKSKITKPGKMVASFTVDTDGSLKDIRMIEMIDTPSAVEMIRVLNNSPKWTPAQRGGKPISITIKYPMVFKSKTKVKS